ncbi:hypothetical protein E2C01_087424 [Portunus trituberculatus]|uniref:Uncharacterized protein n=1 Tax=Portunus trituberculatus TaxID=210409 RepID=A0A5B7J3A9_PORTR|nr:hypothetical protein [Portunus trituberculatus]
MVNVLAIVIYHLRELPSRLLCTILVPSPTRLVKPFSHPPTKTAHVHRLPVQCTDPWLANTLLHGRVYNAQSTNTNITTTTTTTTLTPMPQQLSPDTTIITVIVFIVIIIQTLIIVTPLLQRLPQL